MCVLPVIATQSVLIGQLEKTYYINPRMKSRSEKMTDVSI